MFERSQEDLRHYVLGPTLVTCFIIVLIIFHLPLRGNDILFVLSFFSSYLRGLKILASVFMMFLVLVH